MVGNPPWVGLGGGVTDHSPEGVGTDAVGMAEATRVDGQVELGV